MDVQIGCVCPGTPHVSDTVTLRDTLDLRASLTARNAMRIVRSENPSLAKLLAVLSETYLLVGIEAWTLEDDGPVPVTEATVRSFMTHVDEATVVTDEADRLYGITVLLPLLTRASSSSPPTPTNGSTSPTSDTSNGPPEPSKPSWTSTTPTDATVTTSTSPAGVSS